MFRDVLSALRVWVRMTATDVRQNTAIAVEDYHDRRSLSGRDDRALIAWLVVGDE